MTDRLKVSLFDTLMPYGFEGVRVLDLYAGSGSLGIEMLSRGAVWVDFVEQNLAVCGIIRDNLATTRLSDRAHIYKMFVARYLAMLNQPQQPAPVYDIIFLDPPYADPAIAQMLEAVAGLEVLASDGLVVIGHADRVKLAEEYGGGRIKRARHRVMGGSAFSIYERVPDKASQPE